MTRWSALLLVLGLAAFARSEDKKEARKLTADEQALIELTNAERKKAELKPLAMNPQLMEAARKHAENMAVKEKLDHNLDGEEPGDRAKAAGYRWSLVGENIAWNQKTPPLVMESWMNSEGHRENILHKEFTEIGVAEAKNKKGESYWVQVFGKP